jgi:hypothetical protein
MYQQVNNMKDVEKIFNASKNRFNFVVIRCCFVHRIRMNTRGAPREARCECNDQVEMCG